ncbi:MAG: SDR family oxidoreductase [Candidatus Delongbacteria bacterium]
MRQVLISGGGSGIGLACARRLLAAGERVLFCGRNRERLEAALRGLEAEYPGQVTARVCDVSRAADVAALGQWLRAEALPIDVLVNNAGLFVAGSLLKAEEEQAQAMWETQVLGPWRLLKICADPALRQGRPLRVINVISVTALKAYAACGFYGATKAALASLMDTARAELRDKGVGISNVYPGATETPIWGDRELDYSKMMDADAVAAAVQACADASSRALVEELVLRPAGGDL